MTTEPDRSDNEHDSKTTDTTLGEYLSLVRDNLRMTLRAVEEATDRNVSNAYLSQLENSKITKPSPNILHALAKVYAIPYESLMQKAGYISPSRVSAAISDEADNPRHGRLATLAYENLTDEEEVALAAYLAGLRKGKEQLDSS